MQAPDKIFTAEAMETEKGLFGLWTDKDHRDTPYAEYIRKEDLLEWAEEYKVELLDSAKTMDTDSVGKCINAGALTMLDNVIDKINSL